MVERKDFETIFARITNYYKIETSAYDFMEFCDSFKEFKAGDLEKNFTKLKLVDFSFSRKDELLSAVIREFYKILLGGIDERAIRAWDSVLFAMNVYGAYASVAFKDKAIMKAIENIGGWVNLNNISESELKWAKKEFIATYKAFDNKPLLITHLAGICEIDNSFLTNAPQIDLNLIGFENESCKLDVYLKKEQENAKKSYGFLANLANEKRLLA